MNSKRLLRAWRRFVLAPLGARIKPQLISSIGLWRVKVDLRDHIIGRTLFVYRGFEPELQCFIRCLELTDATVVDVGANLGWHTLALSEAVGETGKVFAFEPEARNFSLLESNLQRNGISNVKALNYAASEQIGVAHLNLHPSNFGDHRLADDGDIGRTVQKIKLTTLDEILQEVPSGALKFVKIDVQGHEMQVIHGMKETLARHPDVILAVEVSPDLLPAAGSSATELMENLRDLGFAGWELQPHRVMPLVQPWAYELIRDGQWADVLISRNHELLSAAMSRYCGTVLP